MMKVIYISLVLIISASASLSYADIYKYVDENGNTLFTNVYRGSKNAKVISEGHSEDHVNSNLYSYIISSMSSKYNIEPSVIKAVIAAESNWQHDAVSSRGAIGLMQLMPSTIKDMNVNDPYDPEDNIEGGTKYLRLLLDRFNGDLELALAAYNSGPGTVTKYNGVPPIKETRRYVRKVLSIEKEDSESGKSTHIFKVSFDDGTILYTNNPSRYQKYNPSKF
jgi:soluble lytic murein transglycosylase